MIPKVIHYCWFGKNKMPTLAHKCIDSWKIFLPDYELKLWNENNFRIDSVPYVKEAYEVRKFAFITDYVRLYVLFHFGGIYMDTDVEIIKSLDELLQLPGFSGFESEFEVQTGIMACEQYNCWAKEQLDLYTDRHFRKLDGTFDTKSNVKIISQSMAQNGFILNNTYQLYKECMHFFPKDYFCPKSSSGNINITPNTYCIHHFAGSWLPKYRKVIRFFYRNIFTQKVINHVIKAKARFS